MAYATVAGLPVAVGLYTAFVPMLIYALLGTSRVLSVSSTATLAILTATQLGLAVPDGDPGKLITAVATLSALTGALLLLASALRLGFVANFISTPVLTGFKAGIGLVIILDQVPKLLGIHITKQGFFRDILSVIHELPDTSLLTLAVAAATLLLLAGMERQWPHSPAPLIAVGGGIAASWFFGLNALGVGTVGLIPQGFPAITLPDPGLVEQLLPGALGIALMSFTETIAAGRAFAKSLAVRSSAPCQRAAVRHKRPWFAPWGGYRKRHRWLPQPQRREPCSFWRHCSDCCRTPFWHQWSSSIRSG
jgi:MFS superfamily sulfate permease-like transporter